MFGRKGNHHDIQIIGEKSDVLTLTSALRNTIRLHGTKPAMLADWTRTVFCISWIASGT